MKAIVRCIFLAWSLGFFYILIFGKVGFLYWIGLSNMDVFNASTLNSISSKFIYYRKGESQLFELPFMTEKGKPLGWLQSEDFKYRIFFPLTLSFSQAGPSSSLQNKELFWKSRQRYLIKPAIFDLCQKNLPKADYILKIQDPTKNIVTYGFNIDRSQFSPTTEAICRDLHNRMLRLESTSREDNTVDSSNIHFENFYQVPSVFQR